MALVGTIRESFLHQAKACREMGSPFTALVCEVLAEGLDSTTSFGQRIAEWSRDPISDALPLRAAGGLNYLVLKGSAPTLSLCYPPHPLPDAASLWSVFADIIDEHDEFLTAFLDSPPQTNEVSRSAAILVGSLAAVAHYKLPLEIYEVGSSAGLNLWFDHYQYDYGAFRWGEPDSPVLIRCDWSGPPPDLHAKLRITNRFGCDQRPLDPASGDDRLRLLCYVWPDQVQRVSRLKAALELAATAGLCVERADAADWVDRHFAEPKHGVLKVLVHTVVWQYLNDHTRSRITQTMERAGRAATAEAGIAWLRLEHDGEGRGAGLYLRQWPEGEDRLLARFDFHGRWAEAK